MTAISFEDGDNFIRNAVTVLGDPRWCGRKASLRRISAGALPVTVDEICEDLRVDDPDDEADTVERLAKGAADFIERRTGYAMRPGVYELSAGQWWSGAVDVLRGPLRDVEAVEYQGERDVWTPVPALDYWAAREARSFRLRFLDTFTRPSLWQPEDCVRVRFSAGFDSADETGGDLPIEDGLRTVLLMVTGHYYRNREMLGAADPKYGLAAVELGATSLLGQYRQFW